MGLNRQNQNMTWHHVGQGDDSSLIEWGVAVSLEWWMLSCWSGGPVERPGPSLEVMEMVIMSSPLGIQWSYCGIPSPWWYTGRNVWYLIQGREFYNGWELYNGRVWFYESFQWVLDGPLAGMTLQPPSPSRLDVPWRAVENDPPLTFYIVTKDTS